MKTETVSRDKKILFWVAVFLMLVFFLIEPWCMRHVAGKWVHPSVVFAQERTNTVYVAQMQGPDVATKVTNAQASCSPNTTIPCVIVIDAIMAVWPQGSLPGRCANCIWIDYRGVTFSATPLSLASATSIVINGATSGSVTLTVPAVAGANTATFPAATGNVVLDSATQTLSAKTLASPAFTGTETGMSITSPTISSPTITGAFVSGSGWARASAATCANAGGAGAACNTAVTWGATLSSGTYTALCELDSPNQPGHIGNTSSKTTTGMNVSTVNDSASAVTTGTVRCTAMP